MKIITVGKKKTGRGAIRQGDSRVIRDADKSGAGKMNLNRKILLMLWHGRTAPQFKNIRNRTKRNHKTREGEEGTHIE